MDLKDILQSRNKEIAECRDLIMSLDSIEDSDEHNELKSLLRRKKNLLVELNAENYQDTIKELKIINEKIYVSSNIIRNKITKFKEFNKFNPILAKLSIEKNKLKSKDILKFSIKHQFITTFIFLLIGSFVFGAYFLEIDYFPILNKESFIYFLFILSGIGALYVFLFLFIPFIIQKILSKIFQIQYMKKKVKLLFIILPLLISIILFKYINITIANQTIFAVGATLILGFASRICSSNIANFLRILISSLAISLLITFFIPFAIQLPGYIYQHIILLPMSMILTMVFLILFVLYEIRTELILYGVYSLFIISVLISTSSDVMKLLHFGNYSPDTLILKPGAKDIIPSDYPFLNNTLKKPKILSNIGDEYYIELKTKPNKTLRLSIPKNLVLSEQNEVEEKVDETKDTKEQSKPEEKMSQKTSQ